MVTESTADDDDEEYCVSSKQSYILDSIESLKIKILRNHRDNYLSSEILPKPKDSKKGDIKPGKRRGSLFSRSPEF